MKTLHMLVLLRSVELTLAQLCYNRSFYLKKKKGKLYLYRCRHAHFKYNLKLIFYIFIVL